MLEEVKAQVGENPLVKELADKLNLMQSDYDGRKKEELRVQQEKQRKEQKEAYKKFDFERF